MAAIMHYATAKLHDMGHARLSFHRDLQACAKKPGRDNTRIKNSIGNLPLAGL
jgi:hypothetical protein